MGKYAPNASTTCDTCAAGFYDSDDNASTPCIGCAAGKYQPKEGTNKNGSVHLAVDGTPYTEACHDCDVGRYTGNKGKGTGLTTI